MLKYLSELDIFGTPFYFNTSPGKTHYQTLVGGLTTLIVLTLSFLYFLYVVIQWKDGLLLPKISSSLVTSTYHEFNVQGEVLRIGIANQDGLIDPFGPINNIITPLVIYMSDFKYSEPQAVFSQYVEVDSGNFVIIKDVELVQQTKKEENQKSHKFMFLTFTACNTNFLKEGQTCAPQNQIDDYIKNFAQVMMLKTTVNQFDTVKNSFKSIVKDSFLIFDNNLRLYTQLTLQYTQQKHDEGILFSKQSTNYYVSDYEQFSQVVTQDFGKKYFGFDAVATFLVKLNDLRVEQLIVEIKITEILAQVGSMISILLSIRSVVEFLNHKMMRQDILDKALKIKYPMFTDIKIRRNFLGKIVEVRRNEERLDIHLFKPQYDVIEKKMQQNLTISYLLGTIKMKKSKKKKYDTIEIEKISEFQSSKVVPVIIKSPAQNDVEKIFQASSLGGEH